MTKELKARKLNLDIGVSKEDKELDSKENDYLDTINRISKIFYDKDYTTEECLVILDSLITGICVFEIGGYDDMRQIDNI